MGREIYFTLGLELVKVIIEWFRNRESRGAIREAAAKHRCARLRAAGKLPKGVMLGALVGLLAMLGAGCAWLGSIDWGSLPPIPVPPAVTNDVPPVVDLPVPGWQACRLASCWQGNNAQVRHMNILSPKCSDKLFRERVAWAKGRGCTVIHAFLGNQGDGEFAGYCIYGGAWDWSIDQATVKLYRERIDYIRGQGLAFVPWLFADDSGSWNATAAKDFGRYLRDLKAEGILDQASFVVVGLELTEYYEAARLTAAQSETLIMRAGKVKDLVAATRAVYGGMVATHENSGSLRFAALADIVMYQTSPGRDAKWIEAEARRVDALLGGKPWGYIELSRHEDRALCEAALRGGADMVGNW